MRADEKLTAFLELESAIRMPENPLAKLARLLAKRARMGVGDSRRQRWQVLVCWLMFAAGLFIQLLAPHLKISNRAFVIPPKLTTEGNNIRLVEIIGRQRQMQVISALLTLGGAIGLVVLYRDTLTGKASRQRANRLLGESDVIPREVNVQRDAEKPM